MSLETAPEAGHEFTDKDWAELTGQPVGYYERTLIPTPEEREAARQAFLKKQHHTSPTSAPSGDLPAEIATDAPFEALATTASSEALARVLNQHWARLPDGVGQAAQIENAERMRRATKKKLDEEERARPIPADPYIDVATVLADDYRPPVPSLGVHRHEDGWQILYAGMVNTIFGDPESGKTLFAAACAVEVLRAGGSVLWLDLDHNGAAASAGRLLTFGAKREWILDRDRFRLAEPESSAEVEAIVAEADSWHPTLAVIDSVGELLPLWGTATGDPNDHYTIVHRAVMSALAKQGAGVLTVDHLTKSGDSRGSSPIGAIAKKRAVDGIMIRAKVIDPLAPGRIGATSLHIVKDRHGGVRSLVNTGGVEPLVGVFNLDSTGPVSQWRLFVGKSEDAKLDADLSDLLELNPPPASVRDIRHRLSWGATRAATALKAYREHTRPGYTSGYAKSGSVPEPGTEPGTADPRDSGESDLG